MRSVAAADVSRSEPLMHTSSGMQEHFSAAPEAPPAEEASATMRDRSGSGAQANLQMRGKEFKVGDRYQAHAFLPGCMCMQSRKAVTICRISMPG